MPIRTRADSAGSGGGWRYLRLAQAGAGWRRLAPWAHFWTGVPIVLAGIFGSTSVAAANAWMTAPSGFRLNAERPRSGPSAEVHARQAGRVARVDVEAEFLGHLTPASVPGRLPVGLQDAAGNRPA
jgi:hypothetical protein